MPINPHTSSKETYNVVQLPLKTFEGHLTVYLKNWLMIPSLGTGSDYLQQRWPEKTKNYQDNRRVCSCQESTTSELLVMKAYLYNNKLKWTSKDKQS